MTLKIIKYLNYNPSLEANINSGDNSIIIGNTFVGRDTILEDNVVIRGDGKEVTVGKNCLFKNRSTVHVAAEIQGTEIGDNSLIGEYSIIHACKLRHRSFSLRSWGLSCVPYSGNCELQFYASCLRRGSAHSR